MYKTYICREVKSFILFFCDRVASRFCRYASFIVGIEWELRGLENWDNEQCYIVISNHQSSLDILGKHYLYIILLQLLLTRDIRSAFHLT